MNVEQELKKINNYKKKNIAISHAYICDAVDSYLLNMDCFDADQLIALPRLDYHTEFNSDWANNPELVLTKYLVFILLTYWGYGALDVLTKNYFTAVGNSPGILEIAVNPTGAFLEGNFVLDGVIEWTFNITINNSGWESIHIDNILNLPCNMSLYNNSTKERLSYRNILFKDLTMDTFNHLLKKVIV